MALADVLQYPKTRENGARGDCRFGRHFRQLHQYMKQVNISERGRPSAVVLSAERCINDAHLSLSFLDELHLSPRCLIVTYAVCSNANAR